MAKVLTAQKVTNPIKSQYLNEDLEIIEISANKIEVELDKIARAVEPPLDKQLEFNIQEHGMFAPVILAKNNMQTYDHCQVNVNPEYMLNFDNEKEFLCIFGNQRIRYANKSGYTAIEAIVVDSPIEAITFNRQFGLIE